MHTAPAQNVSGAQTSRPRQPILKTIAVAARPDAAGYRQLNEIDRSFSRGLLFAMNARIHPYAGLLGFESPALAPRALKFLYTADFGGGLTIFRKARRRRLCIH
jgi:hypothetical protein